MPQTPILAQALPLLACPACHGPLAIASAPEEGIRCYGCGQLYPVQDGIPILIQDRTVELQPENSKPLV